MKAAGRGRVGAAVATLSTPTLAARCEARYITVMANPKPPRPALAPRNGERLRFGLTGLGAIFLIVMVVAAGLRPMSRQPDHDRKGESLAVLGVAPGAGSSEQTKAADAARQALPKR